MSDDTVVRPRPGPMTSDDGCDAIVVIAGSPARADDEGKRPNCDPARIEYGYVPIPIGQPYLYLHV